MPGPLEINRIIEDLNIVFNATSDGTFRDDQPIPNRVKVLSSLIRNINCRIKYDGGEINTYAVAYGLINISSGQKLLKNKIKEDSLSDVAEWVMRSRQAVNESNENVVNTEHSVIDKQKQKEVSTIENKIKINDILSKLESLKNNIDDTTHEQPNNSSESILTVLCSIILRVVTEVNKQESSKQDSNIYGRKNDIPSTSNVL